MTKFTRVIAIFIVLALGILCQQVISNSFANQHLKADSAEINHIKYGLFSVDEWKRQLESIVSEEIGDFDLSRSNEKELKKQIEAQLGVLIDQVNDRIHKANQGSFKGRIKQAFINSVVDINQIKAGIPDYADAMVKELKKAKNERKLKKVVKREVAKYFEKTFDVEDRTSLNEVLMRAGTGDVAEAKAIIADRINQRQQLIEQQSWLMIGLAVVLFGLVGLQGARISPFEYGVLVVSLILLLAVGIATPMIDMEAKISSMKFVLLDHEIVFSNQILYFQSKSILDVFWLMIRHPDIAMKFVGVLVVTFSVLFPVTKLTLACFYYFDAWGVRKSKIVEFFVMKSGKWSMSDVLVVAIFMAYIGFNGILSSQLAKLRDLAGDVDLLTTNGTTLQPGFFLFFTYVLLSLALTFILSLKKKEPSQIRTPAMRLRPVPTDLVAQN